MKTVLKDVLTVELFAWVLALVFTIANAPDWAFTFPITIAIYGILMIVDYFLVKD